MLEGLAVEAASTRRRTGFCCCSCKSAAQVKLGGQVPSNCLSVGEARWSGPHQTASVLDSSATLSPVPPLHCLPVPPDSSATLSAGASRQLLYTVSWLVVTLLLPVLLASARFCRGAGWGVEGSRLEAWMKSHKSEVAIT